MTDKTLNLLARTLPALEIKFENAVHNGSLGVADYEPGTVLFDVRDHLLQHGKLEVSVAGHDEYRKELKRIAANRKRREARAEKG